MNERGIALPLALMILGLLVVLTLAFTTLTATEPLIADNHQRSVRARAIAEAGLERAIWALGTPGAAGGVPEGETAPSQYDGTSFFAMTDGGYTLRITAGPTSEERLVTVTGWVPTNDASDPRPKSMKKIETTVTRLRLPDPVCALCVNGTLEVLGHAEIDARQNNCAGVTPAGITTTDTAVIGGSASVYGAGDDVPNGAGDTVAGARSITSVFTSGQLAVLKSLAQQNGTYYRGTVNLASTSLRNGVVFVDTATGEPYTSETSGDVAANVTVSANLTWSGWLIAAGSITITGNVNLTGIVYALDNIAYRGGGQITGSLISEGIRREANTVDVSATGSGNVYYNCTAIRTGNGTIPGGWFVKPGTYRQADGQ